MSVSCEGCGACCEFMLFHVNGIIPADWAQLREVIRLKGYVAFYHPCKAYVPESNRCAVHAIKPEMCKQYEVGCKDCLICRKIKGVSQALPQKEGSE